MKTPQELKNSALTSLSGNWAPAVVATIVYILVACICVGPNEFTLMSGFNNVVYPWRLVPPISTSLLSIFILINLGIGFYNSFRLLVDEGDNRLTQNMFSRAFSNYLHKLVTFLLYGVIVTVGYSLFILPGIFFTLAYSMVPYILDEKPELSAVDTLRESRMMMRGHKFDLFYFWLTFIGWGLLSLLTLGIGFFWLMPYYYTARVGFYNDIKNPNKDYYVTEDPREESSAESDSRYQRQE